jgi:eukaryotic-like serine/threonine-protein kinase
MAFAPGTVIGSYEITSLLGRGGMGEVWRAHDRRLGRDVAIKTLPDEFATNEDRLARFEREAKLLAPLNHPNIASIYGLDESGGSRFLILELVEGETLADRLKRGPIPLEETIPLALQIAAALEAAHEKGIIHRDLKPGNIKITPDGKVKVLDFGLAKALANDGGDAALSNSPTLSMAATQQGVILGTAAYMSPEQARGRRVDKRADIWAFGCVLYETLTGRPPFTGADVSEVLAGVIKSDADWNSLPAAAPPMVRIFLKRCLEKDPSRRINDIGDVRLALEGAFDAAITPATPPGTKPQHSRRRIVFVGTSAFICAALLATLLSWVALRPAAMAVVRLTATPPGPFQLAGNPDALDGDIAISNDGKHIVYAMGDSNLTQQLYVRTLDQLDAKALPGTNSARSPFISPDGNWIGFFEESELAGRTRGSLKKIAINGGPAVTICSIDGFPRGASWGADNRIIFATGDAGPQTGLLRVDAGGGTPEILTRVEQGQPDHLFPEILPGGRAVLFTTSRAAPLESQQIAVLDLSTGTQKVLVKEGSTPHYVAGYIVYAFAGTLRAVPFDINRLEIRGNPVPVIENAVIKPSGAADFSIAPDGTLVYVAGTSQSISSTLVWVDRQGREEPLGVPPRMYTYAYISPDGTRVALDIRDQANDIWIWDFMRRALTRFTFDPGPNREAVWTPDGRRLAFSAQRERSEDISWQSADGTGAPEPLTKGANLVPLGFSPDGKRLLVQGPQNILIVNLDGDHRTEPLFRMRERNAGISPDGRWIAYESDESGLPEIYVRPFPEINGGRWQISVGGGTRPAWSRNGRELFYYIHPGKLMGVSIQPGSIFTASNPQVIFEGEYLEPVAGRNYDVSPDGKRFLMIKGAQLDKAATPNQLVVVLNWTEELKRLAGK